MAELEQLKCLNCGGMFWAMRHYHNRGHKHERYYCDQQCRTDAQIAESIPVEEIARRARIIRELRESGVEVRQSMLDWFGGKESSAKES